MKAKKWIFILIAILAASFVLGACGRTYDGGDYSFEVGDFISLRNAYEIGLISKADLQAVAANRNGGSCVDGGGDPIDYMAQLSDTTRNILVSGWAVHLAENYGYSGGTEGISVRNYHGTYNGVAVVMMSDCWLDYTQALWDDNIDGVIFYYGDGQSLSVCVVDKTVDLAE